MAQCLPMKDCVTWDRARADLMPASCPTASRGRHCAPEPDSVDELNDTVAISAHCSTYGRHAARPADLLRLVPATGPRMKSAESNAAESEPDADASSAGSRTTIRRFAVLAGYLRPRAARRSA
jgi:hypothetical protein